MREQQLCPNFDPRSCICVAKSYLNAASAVVGTATTRREQVEATSRSALDAFASTTIAPGAALAGGGSSSSSTAARSACASASSGGLAHRNT